MSSILAGFQGIEAIEPRSSCLLIPHLSNSWCSEGKKKKAYNDACRTNVILLMLGDGGSPWLVCVLH